ncbi:MAG: rhomboid family intramembrane serine protease [Streptosporangiaceae bacterium]
MAVPPGPEMNPETGIPTCYRHPGRETYVSCVRCGRPACPDCLRSAAVGQQCVECIRAGNRDVRRPQGQFGGRLVSGARVTWALVAVNVLLWLVELAHQNLGDDWAMFGYGVASGQWYRLITSAFLPPPGLGNWGPLDIIFNMYALILVGPALERALGAARFLSVYLVSALGGSVMFYYLAPPGTAALGASGAIFGLFGAWFVLARRMRVDARQIVFLIGINLVFSFTISGIAWQAHVGGLLAGGLLTAAYAYAPRANRALIQGAATVAMLVILVVAVVIRDQQLAGTVRF